MSTTYVWSTRHEHTGCQNILIESVNLNLTLNVYYKTITLLNGSINFHDKFWLLPPICSNSQREAHHFHPSNWR